MSRFRQLLGLFVYIFKNCLMDPKILIGWKKRIYRILGGVSWYKYEINKVKVATTFPPPDSFVSISCNCWLVRVSVVIIKGST